MSIKSLIESDGRVQVLAVFGVNEDRLLIKAPIDLIQTHDLLREIRATDPEIDLLNESTKRTNGPAYQPLIYAEVGEDKVVRYYVADGHQRLRAEKNRGATEIFAQVNLAWHSAKAAFEDCIQIQNARYQMTDADLFNIIKQDKLTTKQLENLTGKSDTTIEKMEVIAKHPILVKLVGTDKVMSINQASGLVKSCNKDTTKLDILERSLEHFRKEAKDEADHFADLYEREGMPPKRSDADRKNLIHYFKKEDWGKWSQSLENPDPKTDDNNRLVLGEGRKAKGFIRVFEDAKTWKEQIGIRLEGSLKLEDLAIDNLKKFRASLPMIGEKLDTIIAAREKSEGGVEFRPVNPTKETQPPAKPKKQQTDMEVE